MTRSWKAAAGRILIHSPSLKFSCSLSLRGTSGERAGEGGVPSNCRALWKSPLPGPTAIELSIAAGRQLPSPSPREVRTRRGLGRGFQFTAEGGGSVSGITAGVDGGCLDVVGVHPVRHAARRCARSRGHRSHMSGCAQHRRPVLECDRAGRLRAGAGHVPAAGATTVTAAVKVTRSP